MPSKKKSQEEDSENKFSLLQLGVPLDLDDTTHCRLAIIEEDGCKEIIAKLEKPIKNLQYFQQGRWSTSTLDMALKFIDGIPIFFRQLAKTMQKTIINLTNPADLLSTLYPYSEVVYPTLNSYMYYITRAWLPTRICELKEIIQPPLPDADSAIRIANETNRILASESKMREIIDGFKREAIDKGCQYPCLAWDKPITRGVSSRSGIEFANINCPNVRYELAGMGDAPKALHSCCQCRVIQRQDVECITRCFTEETLESLLQQHVHSHSPLHSDAGEINILRNKIRKKLKERGIEWDDLVPKRSGPNKNKGMLARDGHQVDSQLEFLVDNWLTDQGIAHVAPTPHHATSIKYYDNASNERPDFVLEDCYIEVLGLKGSKLTNYDEKTENKLRIASERGLNIITLAPPHNTTKYDDWTAWTVGGNYDKLKII